MNEEEREREIGKIIKARNRCVASEDSHTREMGWFLLNVHHVRMRVEILLSVHGSNVTHAVSSTVSQQRKHRARNIYIYKELHTVEKERRLEFSWWWGAHYLFESR